MNSIDTFYEIAPFSLGRKEKGELFTKRMRELICHHVEHCLPYAHMMRALDFHPQNLQSYYNMPFLPVQLFKSLELRSIKPEKIFKTLMSSGTTGQAVSRIFLDRDAVSSQQKTLVRIVSEFTGSARMPMLIVDCPSVVKDRAMFSARGAGILGFSIFGADRTYALDDDMRLDEVAIKAFLERHQGEKILLFGFTFIVWQHFYRELLKSSRTWDLSNSILIHGGGWKKLTSEAVSPAEFNKRLHDASGLSSVHNYYGMVEQTGSIYMECEHGHLHASIFSDVITRRHLDFSPCAVGENGIIQVLSVLPESYPGHSLLTEDEGVILGEDDCSCGRQGKYFLVHGRLKNAEIRGCSDTYAIGS